MHSLIPYPGATLDPVPVCHLPIVREVIERLGIHATLAHILPRDKRMVVSDADCVTVMILNILRGRVALYRMDRWLGSTDLDVVVAEGCPADAFNDDRLAATLDRIWDYGTDNVLSEIAGGYLRSEAAPTEYSVHSDTTTFTLHGAYDVDLEPGEPTPTWGHNKDHRPDLKQLVYGLSLHGAVGLPLVASTLDGNASDQAANRLHIERLARLLPREDDVTLVHDCKVFDPVTLGQVLDAGFHFVTLVPRTYGLRERVVDNALASGDLVELAREDGRTKADPDRVYRGTSFQTTFMVGEGDHARQVRLRFLAVESSQLAAKFEAGLADLLARDRAALEKAMRAIGKRRFDCESDAEEAVKSTVAEPRLHRATVEVAAEDLDLPRTRRGRPRSGEAAPHRTVYRVRLRDVEVDVEAVEHARRHARFFVLATDHLDTRRWSDTRVLTEYRHQQIIEGHTGFRWLKGPAAVAPMFLKTPRRIAALGLVFVLALLVRNYLQFVLRARLAAAEETVPNMDNRPTAKPTTEVAWQHFDKVVVTRVVVAGRVVQRFLHGLDEYGAQILRLMGWSPAVFTTPRQYSGAGAPG